MEHIINFFRKDFAKKIIVFIVLALIVWFLKPVLNILLLTFIFVYISNTVENFILSKSNKYVKLNEKILTLILYIVMFIILACLLYRYIPLLITQSIEVLGKLSTLKIHIKSDNPVINYIQLTIKDMDIRGYSKNGISFIISSAANIGKVSINVFIAFMLSMFFMLEKKQLSLFMEKFKYSKISGGWKYIREFGNSFLNSFGKVMQAQILIAFVNSILSVIVLWIMGFPQLVALWAMVFILSLIPVAGVIISFVPLALIGYQIGGIIDVAWVIGMIIVLHGFESYVLNPKFMSDKTELPVFLTFIILIVSEKLLGVWGLLIGIPLFIFILDIVGVTLESKEKIIKVDEEKS